MPDEPHLFEYLTVDEHLRLIARLYGVDDFERRARALLDELELTGKEGSLPGELSRGMRQKVVIACGLVRDATTLLFDEPLTGLDPIGIRRMRETIVARAREPARRSCSRRTCCTWSRRSARASSSWTAAGRSPTAPFDGARVARRSRARPDRTSSRSSCASPATTRPQPTVTMLGASLYIIVCSAKNRVRVRLRRLREPRYLIGAIVGVAYLYFSVFARIRRERVERGARQPRRAAAGDARRAARRRARRRRPRSAGGAA